MTTSLKAGRATVDITPPAGTPMAGYFEERRVNKVLDPLFASAVVLRSETTAVAIVSCDLCGIRGDTVAEAKELIGAATGIAPDRVLISATHVHTGPVTSAERGANDPSVADYLAILPRQIASAVIFASRHTIPARILHGRGEEHGIAFNRRYRMKDGTVKTNPGKMNPDIIEPAGPIDPEVQVLRIESQQKGRPLALIVNYALHVDCHGGNDVTADWPGFLRRGMAGVLGTELVTVFLNGAAGNINHVDFHSPLNQSSRHESQRIGHTLAGEVLKAYHRAKEIDPTNIAAAACLLAVPAFRGKPEDIERARAVLGDNWRDPEAVARADSTDDKRGDFDGPTGTVDFDKFYLQRLLELEETGDREIRVPLQVMQIGSVGLAANPGELFVEFGMDIKARSPLEHTMVVELANGSAGYIPTPTAFEEGGYEPSTARVAAAAGSMIVDETLRLFNEL